MLLALQRLSVHFIFFLSEWEPWAATVRVSGRSLFSRSKGTYCAPHFDRRWEDDLQSFTLIAVISLVLRKRRLLVQKLAPNAQVIATKFFSAFSLFPLLFHVSQSRVSIVFSRCAISKKRRGSSKTQARNFHFKLFRWSDRVCYSGTWRLC